MRRKHVYVNLSASWKCWFGNRESKAEGENGFEREKLIETVAGLCECACATIFALEFSVKCICTGMVRLCRQRYHVAQFRRPFRCTDRVCGGKEKCANVLRAKKCSDLMDYASDYPPNEPGSVSSVIVTVNMHKRRETQCALFTHSGGNFTIDNARLLSLLIDGLSNAGGHVCV